MHDPTDAQRLGQSEPGPPGPSDNGRRLHSPPRHQNRLRRIVYERCPPPRRHRTHSQVVVSRACDLRSFWFCFFFIYSFLFSFRQDFSLSSQSADNVLVVFLLSTQHGFIVGFFPTVVDNNYCSYLSHSLCHSLSLSLPLSSTHLGSAVER